MYDCIIIGAGPAGITASIYLERSNKKVLVIGKVGGSLNRNVIKIDNYYGFENTVIGADLYKNGIEQAKKFGVEYIEDEVIAIENEDSFTVKTASNNTYQAKFVCLATGKSRNTLSIRGVDEYVGKGVSFCAICDGFFFRDQRVGLIGYNSFMDHELEYLKNITDKITIFTNGNPLEVETTYPVVTDKLLEVYGDNTQITTIKTAKREHNVDGIFVALGTPSSSDFALRLGIATEKDTIVVNDKYETNVKKIYAIGDCIGGVLQITKASYDGMMVAFNIVKELNIDKNKK